MHAKQTMAVLMRFEDVGGVESVEYNITFIYITNDVYATHEMRHTTQLARNVNGQQNCANRDGTAELDKYGMDGRDDNLNH
jgi:hypothetical protein